MGNDPDADRLYRNVGRCRAAFVGAILGVIVISVSIMSYVVFVGDENSRPLASLVLLLVFRWPLIPIPAAILGAALGIWYQIRIERTEVRLRPGVIIVVTAAAIWAAIVLVTVFVHEFR